MFDCDAAADPGMTLAKFQTREWNETMVNEIFGNIWREVNGCK